MKKGAHPNYVIATVTCACGSVYKTYSTVENIFVETCFKCSPIFTGSETKAVIGQVEKYLKRKAKSEAKKKS